MSQTTSENQGDTGMPRAAGTRTGGPLLVLTLLRSGNQAEQKTLRFNKDRIVVGTVESADLRLLGDGMSPVHLVIEGGSAATGFRPCAYDIASETGVFVNGEKVVAKPLTDGDELVVGRHRLKFRVERDSPLTRKDLFGEGAPPQFVSDPNEDLASLLLQDSKGIEEIFDYSPTSRLAVEVVMSWRGSIIAVDHFVDRTVTVGTSKDCDFAIPPLIASSRQALVEKDGKEFALCLDRKMTGVVQRRGDVVSFDALRETGPAQAPGSEGFRVPFGRDDFAKVKVGEIDFYLSFTPAPPRLKTRKLTDRDPFFLKIFLTSMALTAMTIVALLTATVPQQIEAEQIPERIATILYQPERYQYQPKPPATAPVAAPEKQAKSRPKVKLDIKPNPDNERKPVPKYLDLGAPKTAKAPGGKRQEGQDEALEGEGAKASGAAGKRGNVKAKPDVRSQSAAHRPSPQGGEGRGSGASQVAGEGNIDLLKGASEKILNLLGNSAAQLGKGGERLQGFGGFDTRGAGGAALVGDGKGGGGDAASLGGLGEKGRAGGRVGTGLGAEGTGAGIVGGKSRIVIRSGGPEEAVVMGAIDADAVEAALLAHRDEFRLCYEREINAENPKLAGRVGTSFVIGPSGRVTHAGIESTTLKNASAERCVLNVIRRIQFPIPRGGGVVQVTYPFKFRPVN